MKTVICILIVWIVFLYLGGINISFKPFSVKLPQWRHSFFFLFLLFSLIFFAMHHRYEQKKETYNEIQEEIKKQLNK